jgi:POT family proton-dependent oligopeptide transporter
MFWAVFKQNGTALTRWAKFYTDRQLPENFEKPISKLYLAEAIPSGNETVTRYDNEYRAVKDHQGNIVQEEGRDIYFRNIAPTKMPKDGSPVYTLNTEIFQSVNPAWIILLTPLVVGFFAFLKRKQKEPTTPSKIAIGLVISALSTLVMVGAVYAGSDGAIKVSPWWLIGSYGIITIGELFLSPMGLSLVSKLSPPRLTALMMGGFFLSTAIGNKLSGVLSSMWYSYDNKANFFLVNCALLLFSAFIAFSILKWLNRIMKESAH